MTFCRRCHVIIAPYDNEAVEIGDFTYHGICAKRVRHEWTRRRFEHKGRC